MRAVVYTQLGPARDVLELKELEKPQPAPGEVLVRVHLTGVNPSDVKLRGGARPGMTDPEFPQVIPHSDGAGIIEAVGDGVPETRIGERVWLWNAAWRRAHGSAADYVALPQEQAVPLPEDVSMETGAVLGIPGLTASHCVFGLGQVNGKTVLISGGSGTVGILAVQLAKWGGARVIATASDDMAERVLQAGADTVLNYRATDLAEQIMAANNGQPVEHVVEVEAGLNIDMIAQVIAEGGTVAAYGSAQKRAFDLPFYTLLFKHVTMQFTLIYLLSYEDRIKAIMQLHAALADGALTVDVEQVLLPEQTAAAHEAVEAGHRKGAVLVSFA
ncbi:MAG: NADPH:quinone reductase [Thalassovita sp.]